MINGRVQFGLGRNLFVGRLLSAYEKSASQKIQRKPASAVTVARIAEIVDEARSQEQLTREQQIDYSADRIVEEIAEKTGLKGTSLKLLKPVFRFVFRNAGKHQDNE